MTEPTIAEERLARSIAFWHGQMILYRRPDDGAAITVARLRNERYVWAGGAMDYADRHWREYVPAAQAMLEIRG
jgi:hypothetical protein